MRLGPPDLLSGLLKTVSRSFYLTLRVLPRAIRPQISLAYLLARVSDTIADSGAVPKERRLDLLRAFQKRVVHGKGEPLDLGTLASGQSSEGERLLLGRIEDALAVLAGFDPLDQERIREVLGIIVSGQTLDVERFSGADADHIAALETGEDLDEYIYRVAGCVGEFWTKMCRAHLFPDAPLDDVLLLSNGVRFGKGLQLVNVLRDLPADLRLGRCYLPTQSLLAFGLIPSHLLERHHQEQLQPLYDSYLDLAAAHLGAGWVYTNHLPFRCLRVRLACAWPILIGVQTLAKLRRATVLDPTQRIKISRNEVRSVVFGSVLWYPWPRRWQRLFMEFGARGE